MAIQLPEDETPKELGVSFLHDYAEALARQNEQDLRQKYPIVGLGGPAHVEYPHLGSDFRDHVLLPDPEHLGRQVVMLGGSPHGRVTAEAMLRERGFDVITPDRLQELRHGLADEIVQLAKEDRLYGDALVLDSLGSLREDAKEALPEFPTKERKVAVIGGGSRMGVIGMVAAMSMALSAGAGNMPHALGFTRRGRTSDPDPFDGEVGFGSKGGRRHQYTAEETPEEREKRLAAVARHQAREAKREANREASRKLREQTRASQVPAPSGNPLAVANLKAGSVVALVGVRKRYVVLTLSKKQRKGQAGLPQTLQGDQNFLFTELTGSNPHDFRSYGEVYHAAEVQEVIRRDLHGLKVSQIQTLLENE